MNDLTHRTGGQSKLCKALASNENSRRKESHWMHCSVTKLQILVPLESCSSQTTCKREGDKTHCIRCIKPSKSFFPPFLLLLPPGGQFGCFDAFSVINMIKLPVFHQKYWPPVLTICAITVTSNKRYFPFNKSFSHSQHHNQQASPHHTMTKTYSTRQEPAPVKVHTVLPTSLWRGVSESQVADGLCWAGSRSAVWHSGYSGTLCNQNISGTLFP